MDRGAWRATVYRGAESDTTERLMLSLLVSAAPLSSVLCPTSRPSEAGGGREGAVRRPQQGSSRLELLAGPTVGGRHGFLALLLQGTTLHLSCLWELGADGLAGAPLALGAGAGQHVSRLRGGAWATETIYSCPTTGNSVLSLYDL